MSAHIAHERDESGLPLLCDECPRCEEQAQDLGLHLDGDKWRKAWAMMLSVEYGDEAGGDYRSVLDAKLGRSLYYMSLLLQRNTHVDPRVLLR